MAYAASSIKNCAPSGSPSASASLSSITLRALETGKADAAGGWINAPDNLFTGPDVPLQTTGMGPKPALPSSQATATPTSFKLGDFDLDFIQRSLNCAINKLNKYLVARVESILYNFKRLYSAEYSENTETPYPPGPSPPPASSQASSSQAPSKRKKKKNVLTTRGFYDEPEPAPEDIDEIKVYLGGHVKPVEDPIQYVVRVREAVQPGQAYVWPSTP
ncbi:hypothetical protein B0T21DRAFT_448745 [Apiosordaria backusii]|uniref:Uncharacterized protein n=1 Tax=Apiosordaria backusii TaxID=314023 RepID=A0AA40EMA7_9PEZI|nr:hypothetical protein B0T21DRAFT_448745 [Apiosordaria backusii]